MASAVTVCGPRELDDLGLVLACEHLIADFSGELTLDEGQGLAWSLPIQLHTLGQIRQHPRGSPENLDLRDANAAEVELACLRAFPTSKYTVVDVTPMGCGRNPAAVLHISERTGMHIVFATGFGSDQETHSVPIEGETVDTITALYVEELREGVTLPSGEKGPRSGVLVASVSSSMSTREAFLLSAVGGASRRTLAPIFVRLPYYEELPTSLPAEALAILEIAGVPPSRVVFVCQGGAMVTLAREVEVALGLLRRGANLSVQGMGTPDVWLDSQGRKMPSDQELASFTTAMVAAGYAAQVHVGMGVRMRLQRQAFGGYGYPHHVQQVPHLLALAGIERAAVDAILAGNMRRILCWWLPPKPVERKLVRWWCSWCAQGRESPAYADRRPDDPTYYEKFAFRYCSKECLAAHRQAGFAERR